MTRQEREALIPGEYVQYKGDPGYVAEVTDYDARIQWKGSGGVSYLRFNIDEEWEGVERLSKDREDS